MTEAPLAASAAIKVWVVPPTAKNAKGQDVQPGDPVAGYVFPWSWSWKESKQLVPMQSVDAVGSMGQASFRLIRATRQEIGDSKYRTLTDNLVVGSWLCITSGSALKVDSNGKTTDQVDPAAILWVGWISSMDQDELAGTSETVGTVTALGIGHLLDRRQVYGWQQDAETKGSYGETLNTPPQANIAGYENHVIGNAILGQFLNGAGQFKGVGFVFARMPGDCVPATYAASDANVWTRWRLLCHLAACCQPAMNCSVVIATADAPAAVVVDPPPSTTVIASFLNDTTAPEVFDLQNLTWKGALDLLIPDSMGLGWYITVSPTTWTINIFSVSDDGSFGLPANSTQPGSSLPPSPAAVSLPSEPVVAVTVHNDADDLPDELVYESVEPCIFAFTISFADKNLGAMWTAQQESDYKAAGAALVGYPTNTQQQIELNAAVRSGPGYRDVYAKFGLAYNAATNRAIMRADVPVTGGSGATLPMIPQLAWDGTTLKVDTSSNVSRLPYLPTSRFLRTLPWPEGLWTDGTDNRDATSKALPQYKRLGVFRYDTSAANKGYKWVDLDARNGNSAGFSVSIDPDDRAPALRIAAVPQELLALNHWTTGVAPTPPAPSTPATSNVLPESDARGLDYAKLVATVAMESDQKIQIIVSRPGTQAKAAAAAAPGANLNVRRSLIVRDDKLHCWITLRNTILAMTWKNGDFAPDAVDVTSAKWGTNGISLINDNATKSSAYGVLLRNDWPVAQRRANMLAAFTFRKRTACTIERARSDDQPTWAKLGVLWTKVIEVAADTTKGTAIAEVSRAIATCVVEIARSYGDKPRMRVTTGRPVMLKASGSGSPSPSGGGAVSLVGGGTAAQQIADIKRQIATNEKGDTRAPLIVGKGGAASAKTYHLQIVDGQTVYTDSFVTLYGGLFTGSVLTTVPSLYDPNASSGTPGAFTATNGIFRAVLYINDVAQSGYVLGINDGRAGNLVRMAIYNGELCEAIDPITLTLASDQTQSVQAYPVKFM